MFLRLLYDCLVTVLRLIWVYFDEQRITCHDFMGQDVTVLG